MRGRRGILARKILNVSRNSTASQQFFDRLFTPPTTAREAIYATFIDALVAGGVWAKLDCLYVFAADDESVALTNLRQDAYMAWRDDNAGSVVWTPNSGYSGGAFGRRVNSEFNPSTAVGAKYTRNDAMVFAWSGTTTQLNSVLFETGSSAGSVVGTVLYPRWSSGNVSFQVNQAAESFTAYPGNSDGLWIAQRTGANAAEVLRNNVSLLTTTAASTAPVNAVIGCWCQYVTRVFGIGASLTNSERGALQTAVENFLTSIAGALP